MSDLAQMLLSPLVLDRLLHGGTTRAAAEDYVLSLLPREPGEGERRCEWCFGIYTRHPEESRVEFAVRKYCSKPCAREARSEYYR